MPAKKLPARKRLKPIHVFRTCSRCQRRLTTAELCNGWAVSDIDGHVTATVCGPCMTVQEMADAVMFEATLEIGYNTDGRILTREKRLPTGVT